MSAPAGRIGLISVHTCPLAALGGRETGGMNVYVREVARHLGRLGLEVDVFTRSQTPGVPEVVPLGPGARVVHVEAGPQRPVAPVEIVADLGAFIDGVESFQRRTSGGYALLHGHYWLSGLAAVELARRFHGIPVVQMFHTLGVVRNAVADGPAAWVPQVRLDAEAKVAGLADRIVAATPLERAELAWYCGANDDRVRTIPCGVDVDLFSPGDASAARARLGLDAEWVLLFVGRPAPIKGLEVLLNALARLKADGLARADVRLVIVGGERDERRDSEQARLRSVADALGVGGWVDFRGPQLQPDLPDYYRAADLCLVPSHHETFGMAALEAMACGATVVASRVGGLATTIQDGVTGVLVPPRDDVALAGAIAALLADAPRRRTLGRHASRSAQGFAWPLVARALIDLYGELVPDLSRTVPLPLGVGGAAGL
jgi:D-inositol-3-phosphate glycosyltransferase